MANMYAAYQAGQTWSRSKFPSSQSYNLVYSDGVTQKRRLTEAEIDRWARESNEADAEQALPDCRIVDQQGRVV